MLSNAMQKQPDWISPPGDTMISILEERELTVEQFARSIGLTTSTAQSVLDGTKGIDSSLAKRLATILGASKEFWIARESDYRALVEPAQNKVVSNLDQLVKSLPVSDMQKFGWIHKRTTPEEKVTECLEFFGVSSLAQWQGEFHQAFRHAAYKQSKAFNSKEVATLAWLRQGELETQHDVVAKWSPEVLRSKIPNFRRLTWYKSPTLFIPKLKALFGEAGVKFSVVRAPKGCSASGAVRILSDDVPHIQLSFRYLSDDQFWFSLFHEIGHLLLHFDKMPIVENTELTEEKSEQEADDFAAEIIVPIEYRDEMYSLGQSRFPIIKFAKKIGVAPGLVVGQLQFAGVLGYNQMQHLKRRYRWNN